MDIPTTQRLKIVLAGVTILFVAGLIALVISEFLSRPDPPAPLDPAVEPIRSQASGVVFRLEMAGDRRSVVSVEEFDHQRRKLGPLTINPTSAYLMRGVRIELDLGQTEPSEDVADVPLSPPFTEFTGQLLRREKLDPLSRLDIEGFDYICIRSGVVVVELKAERVTVEPGGDGIQLSDGFFIATANGQRLVASRGSLNLENDTLTIDSAYSLQNGDGSGDAGRGAVFLLDSSDFEIRKAPPVHAVDP